MPPRKDDDLNILRSTSRSPIGGKPIIYTPEDALLEDPIFYSEFFMAIMNFRLYWQHEVLKREVSATDFFNALTIELVQNDYQGGVIIDSSTGELFELPDLEEVFGNTGDDDEPLKPGTRRFFSDLLRSKAGTSFEPYKQVTHKERLRIIYLALAAFYLQRFPRSRIS